MGATEASGLKSKNWPPGYRTSALTADGRPADMLHDFYIPVLRRSVRYDRVAGYFSSSSLAVASRGFSAFVERQGRVRLIVGAEISSQDVQAILDGDQMRYDQRLHELLGEPESWPEDVKRGVDLLAWMVAHYYLDVRIAFRVHSHTGHPIPANAYDDGYMHEKWAIFHDEHGHRLLIQGSLNESQRALVLNAENLGLHCDWWSEQDLQRIEEHARDFELLWRDRHPHFRVLTLPEAVRQRLVDRGKSVVTLVEVDRTSAAPKEVPPPSADELLRFAVIRDGPKLPGGRFVGMETAPVEPWPHQAIVARRLIETWPYSYLLCDEVGLGKTIEAGLAIRSLYLSGFARRVLIAPPASLKEQWQREMQSKFLLPFAVTETSPQTTHAYIHPFEEEKRSNSPFTPDLNILSSAILQRRDRSEQVARAEPFDLVLVDEAHACRRQNPTADINAHPDYGLLYKTVSETLRDKTDSLWLATATPMQLERIEAWDLLRLMNRTGLFQDDPRLTFAYYDAISALVTDEELDDDAWAFLRAALRSIEEHDQLLWRYLHDLVIDAHLRQPARRWLGRDIRPHGGDERRVARLLFSGAPLSRVMLRHTRNLLEIYKRNGQLTRNLAQREILPIPQLTFTEAEAAAYENLETYCEELSQQVNLHGDRQQKYNVGFYKSFLRLRFASSFHAIQETVRRRIQKVIWSREVIEQQRSPLEEPEAERVEALALDQEEEEGLELEEAILRNRTAADLRWEERKLGVLQESLARLVGPSTKMTELLRVLNQQRDEGRPGRFEQTVIFTRFYDTLTDIVRRLRHADDGMRIGTYSGQGGQYTDRTTRRLISASREIVKHKFLQGEIDILVCTDAAAEGLNLQSANLIINFDLPWNPMKVEQRIGRLDRIGQKHDRVFVLNLCYQGSVEEIVYSRLLRRLQDAQLIVGPQPFSMLPVTHEEFRMLAEGELTEQGLEQLAMQRAEEQRERSRSMEVPPDELYDIYMRMAQKAEQAPSPVKLEDLWQAISESDHLKSLGCQQVETDLGQAFRLVDVPGVPNRTVLTASRELYEVGMPDDARPHFCSYGDFAFDRLLDYFTGYDLPQCVRRATWTDERTGVEFAAYVVASRENNGGRSRLVFSWYDLEGLVIDTKRAPEEADVQRCMSELKERVREEVTRTAAVPAIEKLNRRAAKAQLLLSYLIAERLLARLSGTNASTENFWQLAETMDQGLAGAEPVNVTGLTSDVVCLIEPELLFKPRVPRAGGEASISASPILVGAAVGAAKREADSLKVRRSELTVDKVLVRLERRIEVELGEFEVI